jgi:hypothetical protein
MNPSAASSQPSIDPYVALHETLVVIHRGITAAFADVLACDAADIAGLVESGAGAGGFLLGHHDAESLLLFPALRRSGVLRSTDVAFLEGLDREHVALHEITARLVAETRAPHPRGTEIVTLAKEIATAFGLHTRGEENGLAAERLRTMITREGLADLARRQEEMLSGREGPALSRR